MQRIQPIEQPVAKYAVHGEWKQILRRRGDHLHAPSSIVQPLNQLLLLHIAQWFAVIVAGVLPWRSFDPQPQWQRIRWIPFVSPPVRFSDSVANVLLYVLFGYFAAASLTRRRPVPVARIILSGLLISTVT